MPVYFIVKVDPFGTAAFIKPYILLEDRFSMSFLNAERFTEIAVRIIKFFGFSQRAGSFFAADADMLLVNDICQRIYVRFGNRTDIFGCQFGLLFLFCRRDNRIFKFYIVKRFIR